MLLPFLLLIVALAKSSNLAIPLIAFAVSVSLSFIFRKLKSNLSILYRFSAIFIIIAFSIPLIKNYKTEYLKKKEIHGIELMNEGRYDEAAIEIQRKIQENPDPRCSDYKMLSNALEANGQLTEAEKALIEGTHIFDQELCFIYLAEFYERNNMPEKINPMFDTSLDLLKNTFYDSLVVDFYEKRGNVKKAETILKRAKVLDNSDCYIDLVKFYERINKINEAEQEVSGCKTHDKISFFMRNKMPDKALKLFNKALEQDHDFSACLMFASFYKELDQIDKACDVLYMCAKLSADDRRYHELLDFLKENRQIDKGIYFYNLYSDSGNSDFVFYRFAEFFDYYHKMDLADSAYKNAIKNIKGESGKEHLYQGYATFLTRNNRISEAEKVLIDANKIFPQSPYIQHDLRIIQQIK